MKTRKTDSLRRATFQNIEPRSGVRPTAREVRWLKHIERHGPQSSEFLVELTRDTHRCKDSALRDLQKLRAAGFLRLPQQQRVIERAEFKPYVYDLTKRTVDHLAGQGIAEKTVRPTGHWWHAYTVSAFTSSWDILAQRRGQEFIPAHRILERSGARLAIPVGKRQLVPDQLFAIKYEDGYRAFLLEVDRATEPLRSRAARKSLAQSVDHYSEVLARDLHRTHYGLKANTVSLWVFTNPSRLAAFQSVVGERAEYLAAHFLCKLLPDRLSWAGYVKMHASSWIGDNGRMIKVL